MSQEIAVLRSYPLTPSLYVTDWSAGLRCPQLLKILRKKPRGARGMQPNERGVKSAWDHSILQSMGTSSQPRPTGTATSLSLFRSDIGGGGGKTAAQRSVGLLSAAFLRAMLAAVEMPPDKQQPRPTRSKGVLILLKLRPVHCIVSKRQHFIHDFRLRTICDRDRHNLGR